MVGGCEFSPDSQSSVRAAILTAVYGYSTQADADHAANGEAGTCQKLRGRTAG